jgi:hypothetical protein
MVRAVNMQTGELLVETLDFFGIVAVDRWLGPNKEVVPVPPAIPHWAEFTLDGQTFDVSVSPENLSQPMSLN